MPCWAKRWGQADRIPSNAPNHAERAARSISAPHIGGRSPTTTGYLRGFSGTENSMLVSPVRRFSKSVTDSRSV